MIVILFACPSAPSLRIIPLIFDMFILALLAKIFMSFPDSIEWRDKIFEGKIISVGNDYVLIKDNKGIDSLLTNIYINYIEFI